MRIPICAPETPSAESWRMGEWAVDVGDHLETGDALGELISAGFIIDLLAPGAGTLREVTRLPEQPVAGGEILGWIESDQN